ncbi:hypothetical protein DdX_12079 [Ditylenchus destructor]|uniref:F-box domain-containing protein n=1 Tax=Ditylenchus destructor TaxID=166010 RepID=A0AAD4R427_9BILA|nr:hypothetical protein DdX_12079 [Ditylenchus destructor]
MDTSRVYLRMQLDIFALFNRPELSRISQTNRRFNAIIENHFATSPYSVQGHLNYFDGEWKWSTNALPDSTNTTVIATALLQLSRMSKNQIAQLSTAKFMRFKETHLVSTKTNTVVGFQALKHLWDGGYLRVSIAKFLRSMDFAGIVNTCSQLFLNVPGSNRVLSGVLQGKSQHIYLIDQANNPTKQLPIIDIVSFLFKDSDKDNSNPQKTTLIIETRYSPNYQLYEEVVQSIKQKFLESSRPPIFQFAKLYKRAMDWPQAHDFTLDHPHCDKKLRFLIADQIGFSLTCSTH